MATYILQFSRCFSHHVPIHRSHYLIHGSCRQWKKIFAKCAALHPPQSKEIESHLPMTIIQARFYSKRCSKNLTFNTDTDVLHKNISSNKAPNNVPNVVPVGIIMPENKDSSNVKIVVVPLDIKNQGKDSLAKTLIALQELGAHAHDIDVFTNKMINDCRQKKEIIDKSQQEQQQKQRKTASVDDVYLWKKMESQEINPVSSRTLTENKEGSALAEVGNLAQVAKTDVAPIVPSPVISPSLPNAPNTSSANPNVNERTKSVEPQPSEVSLGDAEQSRLAANDPNAKLNTDPDLVTVEVPSDLNQRLNDLAISSMQLSFKMNMSDVSDAILQHGEETIEKQPTLEENAVVSFNTVVEPDPQHKTEETVPLQFNALISGTVQLDIDKLKVEQLTDESVPNYQDSVTSIAANVCGTALQKNLTLLSNSDRKSEMMPWFSYLMTRGYMDVQQQQAAKVEEPCKNNKHSAPMASASGAKGKEPSANKGDAGGKKDACGKDVGKKKDDKGGDGKKKDPCAQFKKDGGEKKDSSGKDGGEKKDPCAKDKGGDGKKKDPCAQFKNKGAGEKKDSTGKDGGEKKDPCAKDKGGDGKKKDPCAQFKNKGAGEKKDSTGKDGGEKKDPCAKDKGGDGKKKDPCAQFKNKGAGEKKDSSGKDGAEKKDPCAKDKAGDDKKKDPCAKFTKAKDDGQKKDPSGKDGKGDDKNKDPCAKFKKANEDKKKDPCGKDGGEKKDPSGTGDDKKKDPCAKFKKANEDKKKDPCVKDGGEKKDPSGKGDDKKKNPCAQFTKGKDDGQKKDPSGKDGGEKKDPCAKEGKGGDKNEDPCAKFKKACEDKRKDPCSKDGGENKDASAKDSAQKKDGKGDDTKKDPCAKYTKGKGGDGSGKDDGKKKNPCGKSDEKKKDPCAKTMKFSTHASLEPKYYYANSFYKPKRYVCSTSVSAPKLPNFKILTLVRRRYSGKPSRMQLNFWGLDLKRNYSKEDDNIKCKDLASKRKPRKDKKARTTLRTDCFDADSQCQKPTKNVIKCSNVRFPRKKCPKDNKVRPPPMTPKEPEKKLAPICMAYKKKKKSDEERNSLLKPNAILLNQIRNQTTVTINRGYLCKVNTMEKDDDESCTSREVITIPVSYQICKERSPIPVLSPYDVLLRTSSIALSGSDIHIYENSNRNIENISLGHDATGFVEEVGSLVKSLQAGDRVVMESALSCGLCDHCKRGECNICSDLMYNGFLTTYQTHPADLCHRLPDSISMEEGTLVQTLAMGCQACFKANITPICNLLIIGSTPTAVSAAMCATAMGAKKVIIADTMISALERAKYDFGIETIHYDSNAPLGEVLEAIHQKFRGWPNCAINCAISSTTMSMIVMALQPSSVCVLSECESESTSLNALEVLMKNLRLIPSFRCANMYPTALQLMKSGHAPVGKFIAKIYPWSELETAFQCAQNESNIGFRKVLIENI